MFLRYDWFDLIWFDFWCFNATFSNISAISWRPVLVVEEARVPGENHRPWASNLRLRVESNHILGTIVLQKYLFTLKFTYQNFVIINIKNTELSNNYITSVFHWNVTIWLAMKWSHDYKRDVLHANKTQTRTCTSDINNQWRSNFQQQII